MTPFKRLFQRDERADFIDAAEGTAPSKGNPHRCPGGPRSFDYSRALGPRSRLQSGSRRSTRPWPFLAAARGSALFGDSSWRFPSARRPAATGHRCPSGSARSGCSAPALPGPRTPARACPRFRSPCPCTSARRSSAAGLGPLLDLLAFGDERFEHFGHLLLSLGERAEASKPDLRGGTLSLSLPAGFPSPRWRVPSVSLA